VPFAFKNLSLPYFNTFQGSFTEMLQSFCSSENYCKMHITFNVELDSKTNKNGEKLIMIRATQNGSHKRINTGITIRPVYWDSKKKKAKKICPLAEDINTTVSAKLMQLLQLYLEKVRNNGTVTLFEFTCKTKSS
jgi:hypothetical protein